MPPLPALLAHALLDVNRVFERNRAEAGERPSLLLWADFLRVIPDEGISVTDLPPAARISRRAVRPWLGLEKRGWLEVNAEAPRVKVVRLTEIGRRTRDRCGDVTASTEREWCAKIGEPEMKPLRAALEALVSRLDLELPRYPMTYGASDPSALGGASVAAQPGPPRIPAHGTDWVPALRSNGDTVNGLQLHALLSQALMAFTIDYEEQARFPMSVAAIVAQAMPGGPLPLDDVPRMLGVNGSGKSLLERHGIVRVTRDGKQRLASLTPTGLRIRDGYEPTVIDVLRAWEGRYGEEIVGDLRGRLGRIDDTLANDLPDNVLVRYVPGIGFHDISVSAVD